MACGTLKRRLGLDLVHSSHRTKRCRYIPFGASSPTRNDGKISPFSGRELGLSRLSQEAISSNLKEEERRLHRRKQLHFKDERSNSSVPASSTNDSTEFLNDGIGIPPEGFRTVDKPLFTFPQVELICERMIREREDQLRQTYEQALSEKLSEQYDTFVKFTYDQIQKSIEANSAPSYLS